MKQIQKGFTLVEMIMAIMLMSMIALIIGVIFNTMFSGRELIEREASIQAEMRTSMQHVDRTIGKATSVFILDDSKYKGSKEGLTKEWSYIGLSADGKKVLNYVWDKTKQDWNVSELGTKSLYNMKLDLEFKTDGAYQDNRLINYNLTGKYPDSNNKFSIDTAMSALNSKQVFSKVGKGKKGIALAYRNDPIEGQVNVAISFVFDSSGSMERDMKGRTTNVVKDRRISILREKAIEMVKELKEIGNVSVNLSGFSHYGFYVQKDFSQLDKGTEQIEKSINSLPTRGVTNPGDGLRYGMVSLQQQHVQLKYVVLLTDGIPNAYIVDPSANYPGNKVWIRGGDIVDYQNPIYNLSTKVDNFQVGYLDGAKYSEQFSRLAYDQDSSDSAFRAKTIGYAGEVSKKFGKDIRRVNLIGFSGVKQEVAYGEALTEAIREGVVDAQYVSATDAEELKKTFSDIKKQIQQDLWFVSGP